MMINGPSPDLKTLVDLKTAAEYCRTPEEIILKWTESGHAPHYYIDTHGPLYKKTELKKWLEDNILRVNAGMSLPRRVSVLTPVGMLAGGGPPASIAGLEQLFRVPLTAICSGIYFLCDGPEVVYVGQALTVITRVAQHAAEGVKDFDPERVFFLPCPRADLCEVEKQWIRLLRPKYNRALLPKSHGEKCRP